MKSPQVKRVVAGEVVAAVGRANAFEACVERDAKRVGRKVLVLTEGKRKVADLLAEGRFQVAFRADNFVESLWRLLD